MLDCAISNMKGMWSYIDSLRDPDLVYRFQNYFGVYRKSNGSNGTRKTSDGCLTNGQSNGLRQTPQLHSRSQVKQTKVNGHCKTGSVDEGTLSSEGDDNVSSDSDNESKEYVITNRFWYYVFSIGAAMGDEVFYASFFPVWFWNIDGAVGRRVVLVWSIIMYIGQGIKDIVRWPRPSSPPVIRLEHKWALEYGMPSTHAMVAASLPTCVIFYTLNRYQYSVELGIVFAIIWCVTVCCSRLYMGMHSVLDIVAGLVLVAILMVPMIPLVDSLDHWVLTSRSSPFFLLSFSIFLLTFYPTSDRWTPARGDTCVVVGVSVGIQLGAWINYQLGTMTESPLQPPYAIIWPSYGMLGNALLRAAIGLSTMVATRAIFKSATYATICALLRLNSQQLKSQEDDINNKQKIFVELSYKFITYVALGINTTYIVPTSFRLIGIERPTFYTEI